MKKLVYEKPAMLVEEFVATQSVAANCGTTINQAPINAKVGEVICYRVKNNGSTEPDKGHDLLDTYDTNPKDGYVNIFNSTNGCTEYTYDKDAGGDIVKMGNDLTGTNSWNSDQHHMMIGTIKIPS